MSDLDVLAGLQGRDTKLRIDAMSMPTLLSRVTQSRLELALECVFDNSTPADVRRFYEYVRRRISHYVTVYVSGVVFEAKLADTTKFPAGFAFEDMGDTVFEIVFERVQPRTAANVKKGMIALPVPGRVRKAWANKNLKPDPHITLGYMPRITDEQAQGVAEVVKEVAAGFQPFEVVTHGQGLFGANSRVALVAVHPQMRAFRQLVVAKVLRAFPKIIDMHTHPVWMPHITLGEHDKLPVLNTDAMFTLNTVDVNIHGGSVYSVPFAM